MSDLDSDAVAKIGQEIAHDLGVRADAAELGSFYIGLAVGSALVHTSLTYPALPPAELKRLALDVLGRGGKSVVELIRAQLDQPNGGVH